MKQIIIGFAVVIGLLVVPAVGQAQSRARQPELSAGAGWGSLWDDETMLGRGLPLGGGIAWMVGDRLRLAADVDWLAHSRDAGYLAAAGDVIGVFGRGSYLFGSPAARVRPLAGAGLGVMRSTGTLTTHSIVSGPAGLPVTGPDIETPWTTTRGALDLHGGARIAVNPRVFLRPEFRWRSSFGTARATAIEPPLLNVQAMVLVDVLAW